MTLETRLAKLEAQNSRNRRMIMVYVKPDEDAEEAVAKQKRERGIPEDEDCFVIVVQIVDPAHGNAGSEHET